MINRAIFNKLEHEISRPEITILLGPRQVGKTTLLKMLQLFAEKKGMKTSFFDLEQPDQLARFNISDEEAIKKLRQAGPLVFIAEFHYLKNASKIFKALFDLKKGIKIICSGSSSLEIHKHLRESLAGRRMLFRVFPLEYAELIAHDPKFSLDAYLRFGGMPGLTNADSDDRKEKILSELVESYILKDIKSLIKEENIRAFNHLMYLLAERQGAMISAHSLANQVRLSPKAVDRYLDILEATYVNFRVYSYSTNLGNELKKSFKTYLYDIGMRNAILKDFSPSKERQDKGVLWETFIFLGLQARLKANQEIKFWRTKDGDEVDFILLENMRPLPIEVKSMITGPEIPRGLRRFLLRYPTVKLAYVVNEEFNGKAVFNNCEIRFITFHSFASPQEILI